MERPALGQFGTGGDIPPQYGEVEQSERGPPPMEPEARGRDRDKKKADAMMHTVIVMLVLFGCLCAAVLANFLISSLLFQRKQCPTETTQAPGTCPTATTTTSSSTSATSATTTTTNTTVGTTTAPFLVPKYDFLCQSSECIRQIYMNAINPNVSPCEDFFTYACSGFFNSSQKVSSVTLHRKDNVAQYIMEEARKATRPPPNLRSPNAYEKAAFLFQQCEQRENNWQKELRATVSYLDVYGLTSANGSFDPIDVAIRMSLHGVHVLFQLRKSFKRWSSTSDGAEYEMVASPDIIDLVSYTISKPINSPQPVRGFEEQAHLPLSLEQIASSADFQSNFIVNFVMHPFLTVSFGDAYKTTPEKLWFGSPDLNTPSPAWVGSFRKYVPKTFMRTPLVIPKGSAELFHRFSELNETEAKEFVLKYAKLLLIYTSNLHSAELKGTRWTCYNITMSLMPYAFVWPVLEKIDSDPFAGFAFGVTDAVRAASDTLQHIDAFHNISWFQTRDFQILNVNRTAAESYYYAFNDLGLPTFMDAYMLVSGIVMASLIVSAGAQNPHDADLTSAAVTFRTRRACSLDVPLFATLSPFFSNQAAPEVNYGSLGASIASALLLGDAEFGQSPFFTQTVLNDLRYTSRAHCPNHATWKPYNVSESAKNLTVLGGDVVWPYYDALYEKLYAADLLGIGAAYREYKKYLTGSIADKDVDGDKLFFLSTCYRWCNSGGPTDFELEGDLSPHLRCNEPLKDIPEFAAAFSCPPYSPMNPWSRCVGI
ncbi:uncharacterized protein LOC135389868 [Ornithodoros turicata]|uniref:uncharacterized protein LOC135389868 n=1 Tax=Ornithodoros turicata TaxID=34597 RepID=UPI003138B6AE